ncbi:Three-deoxy-D-manno-octulosonic-acid transferase domain protein OS=Pirellula staleyi (strain ATCC 27377 / DSM 6068 / ICPB 4128) GN=Psta_4166 PE=4 SV=1: Glycos_transf_N [Gemmata massiliana]|uniref:3-deoxy-D-manno-octulosonic acid transferase n=1 Tax=Gemmata massiliana TaxID=1210884 RepID=A0A6P2DL80_9BACT|nr:3-deoxy-D-manno-octulosonic acid transferase [Gemmata massiliana]VTS03271.1 Three-deoxy-D-manno-octulosonic-acid transferase domain protein OS=Pirellula staleyi (strain ATCC 27377 / DSM 6068 / ICPB 4128) GN=Psta_4166 PE=4 SV=1: Glycos_transf_N [Gemmata massiliana]
MLLNLVYLLALTILSPWLMWRAARTGRYRQNLTAKLFGRTRLAPLAKGPVAWFHAVSVGEVNLLGTLVPQFRKRHPDWHVVVSSTTDTGLVEARKQFADLDVIAWPFDFTWAVATALDAVNPSLIVLTESELWPNFLAAASTRNVPVVVVNARLSPRSFRRLKRVAGFARRMLFQHVTRFAVQETEYTERLQQLGVPAAKLVTTGSIKYDGAAGERDTPKTRALRRAIGLGEPTPPSPLPEGKGELAREISVSETLLVKRESSVSPFPSGRGDGGVGYLCSPLILLAGSTHAPEEALILTAFARLHAQFSHLRLILVPRHPDRFEEVARLVEDSRLSFVRRSCITAPLPEMPAVVLLDTVGELGAAWGLADVGFTGGSLDGKRGGQSMIEPAGYGVPCVFGPHVWNFRAAARRLVEVGGAVMVKDATELETELTKLIADADRRTRMGNTARDLVRRQQGATSRTLDVIDTVITSPALTRAA